ncbi:transposase [Rhizobium rhizogenes]|uniref:RNA-guided endonuclease InsQ/TnpB family protein n=1 Tax=Rhizobium rhizogenes TaxID=359 RepID=UPI0022707FA5|nr:transposase [Rhizobium rhizogenes]
MSEQVITIKLRLKDKHASELNRQAKAVNFVWNYCNETQAKAAAAHRKWLSNFALQNLTAGSGPMLGLSAQTVCKVCERYEASRRIAKRPKLRFRGSKSLGWIPFNAEAIKFDGNSFVFRKISYTPMHMRPELNATVKLSDGSFNCDSRGRWYINVPIKVERKEPRDSTAIGIDLGLKVLAQMSNGQNVRIPSFYRKSERALAIAQSRNKSSRVRNINAKIANRRNDFLHKATTEIAKTFSLVAVGDVSSSKLIKTNMAKSVLDAGWATFKNMLSYKTLMHGGSFIEVDEAYTSQTCSMCGTLPSSRPKGIAGLGIREWRCDDCGVIHDRDVNAARNILRIGLDTLVEGAARMRSSQKALCDEIANDFQVIELLDHKETAIAPLSLAAYRKEKEVGNG